MNRKTLVSLYFFLLILFFMPSAFSQEIPKLTPFVNDFANVIPSTYRDSIQSLCKSIESSSGAQIAVLTVDSTQPMSIEEYAVKTFEKNGIGQKGIDNGILIVTAIQDRKWRIEVGYGLEGVINDAKAGNIGRTYMTTNFKEGKYGEGLYDTVKALGDLIVGSNETSVGYTQPPGSTDLIMPIYIMVSIFIIIIIVLIIFLRTLFIKKCPKCGTKMHTHIHYDSIEYHCPKCGYKIVKKKRRVHWIFVGGSSGGGWGGGGGGFGGGGSGGGGASGGW